MSVGVQELVAWPSNSAGVVFSIDTETGFPNVAIVTAAWGLGEAVVKGVVSPDEYIVFKPSLGHAPQPILRRTCGAKQIRLVAGAPGKPPRPVETTDKERQAFVLNDLEILKLAHWVTLVESQYQRPMEIEWAKDATTGDLFLLQARPETAQSARDPAVLKHFLVQGQPRPLLTGSAVGDSVAVGDVHVVRDAAGADNFRAGGRHIARSSREP